MFCANCGKKIESRDQFCPHCGQATALEEKIEKKEEEKIGAWSWGAFAWSWLFFYQMKYKKWLSFLILVLISNGLMKSPDLFFLGFILWLIVAIYSGINGRKIAWENHKWEDINQFRKAQRAWDINGIIIWIIFQIIFFYI